MKMDHYKTDILNLERLLIGSKKSLRKKTKRLEDKDMSVPAPPAGDKFSEISMKLVS